MRGGGRMRLPRRCGFSGMPMSKMLMLSMLAASVLATGCAAQVVSSSPRSVIVKGRPSDAGEAHKLAEAECRKHGRFARLSEGPRDYVPHFVFDCVQ